MLLKVINMFRNKNKKVVKLRGSHTHGGGSKKKRRGAGNRGGRGLAGTGKRGDQKKTLILKKIGKSYFGKKGFKSIHKKRDKVINLKYLNDYFEELVERGVIIKDKTKYIFNIKLNGYDKVLGSGNFNKKVTFINGVVSKKAKEKIEKAGGEILEEEIKKDNKN